MARETDPLLGRPNGHNGSALSSSSTSSSRISRVKAYLSESVDVDRCGPVLAMQCFIAGAADAAVYTHTNTWAAFMTGNMTQLSMSVVTLLLTRPLPKESIDRFQASGSAVFGFMLGAYIASLIDARYHGKHRGKLAIMSLIRSVIFVLMAFCIYYVGWNGNATMGILLLLAINMGTMAVNANRLGGTPYATTVVVTASLSQIFSDPLLPLSLSTANKTRGKSILSLIAGGACSQAIAVLTSRAEESSLILTMIYPQAKQAGSAYAIGLVAVVELIAATFWLRVGKEE